MRSVHVLQAKERISSVDLFRGIAILLVVLYHFHNYLPYGYLGVDLFFVISGLLVGGQLVKKFKDGEKINFLNFFLRRGFKIWPSYYSFLLIGSLLAFVFYRHYQPEFIIPLKDSFRYIFFYQNYQWSPYHWPFDHIWSLCVEEHFYILLPLFIMIISSIKKQSSNLLIASTSGLILAGIFFKYLSTRYGVEQDTYYGTHNRIDALGWGVLLAIIIRFYDDVIRKSMWRKLMLPAGIIIIGIVITGNIYFDSFYFRKIIFHSLAAFSFFLMIFGVYYYDFSKWKPIRFIAYYSYNWYLWHPLFVWIVSKYFGVSVPGLLVYMILSFSVAVFFTVLVEERFLSIRGIVMDKIFKQEKPVVPQATH